MSRPDRATLSFLENSAKHAGPIQLSYKEAIAIVIATRGTSGAVAASQKSPALDTVCARVPPTSKGSLFWTNSAAHSKQPPRDAPPQAP